MTALAWAVIGLLAVNAVLLVVLVLSPGRPERAQVRVVDLIDPQTRVEQAHAARKARQ